MLAACTKNKVSVHAHSTIEYSAGVGAESRKEPTPTNRILHRCLSASIHRKKFDVFESPNPGLRTMSKPEPLILQRVLSGRSLQKKNLG